MLELAQEREPGLRRGPAQERARGDGQRRPAGCARRRVSRPAARLAVDREHFAGALTERIESHPSIEVVREEATDVPNGRVIVATGPLTSPAFEVALGDAGRSGAPRVLRRRCADRRGRVARPCRRVRAVAIRQGRDGRLPQRADDPGAVRRVLRRPDRCAARHRQGVRAFRPLPGVPARRGGRPDRPRLAAVRCDEAGRADRPGHRRCARGRSFSCVRRTVRGARTTLSASRRTWPSASRSASSA